MKRLMDARWKRAIVFGLIMGAAAFGLTLAFPLRGGLMGSRLRVLYAPGLVASSLVGEAGSEATIGQVFLIARVATPVCYALVGIFLGAALPGVKSAVALCLAVLVAAPCATAWGERVDQRQRAERAVARLWADWEWSYEQLKTEPDNMEAHNRLAFYAFTYFDKPDVALKEYAKVLELEGDEPTQRSVRARLVLAILHKRAGRMEEARAHFEHYETLAKTVRWIPGDDLAVEALERECKDLAPKTPPSVGTPTGS